MVCAEPQFIGVKSYHRLIYAKHKSINPIPSHLYMPCVCVLPTRCVSDDGVYTCECSSGWAGTFCDIHCPLDCGQYGYCAVVGAREGPSAESGHNSNDSSSNSNSNNSNITADIACVCQWNRTGSNCEDTRRIVPTIYGVFITSYQCVKRSFPHLPYSFLLL